MTVSTINSVAEFVTNGVTTNFPFYFKFLENKDLVVTFINPDGISSDLVMGTHYTVSGAGNENGGSVITTSALAGPGQLIVSRDMEAYQQTSLRNQGKFLAETHEDVFDKLTMLIQQGFAIFKRALTRPFGRDYFYAENRRITSVKDPVEPQDAATKIWAQRYVGAVIGGMTGNPNLASNVFYLGSDGIPHTVQDLSSADGASIIGMEGGGSVQDALIRKVARYSELSSTLATKAGEVIELSGHTQPGVGGGRFYWDATSTAAEDGGAVAAVSGVAVGRWLRPRITNICADLWGMLPGLLTDQSQAVQKAINYASSIGGGVIRPVAGTSYIALDKHPIMGVGVSIPSSCWLDMRGCEFRAVPSSFDGYSIVLFNEDCDLAGVFGGRIVGDREGHVGATGEWGMGIAIRGAKKIFVDSMLVSKCWGDGVFISNNLAGDVTTGAKQIWIDKIICDQNRRQGMSIVNADDVYIPTGIFKNTNGIAPQAGIDIEPNAGGAVTNVRMGSIHCSGNAGAGLLSFASSSVPVNKTITIESLVCELNGSAGLKLAYCSGVSIGSYFGSDNSNKCCSIESSNNIYIGRVSGSNNSASGAFARGDFEVVGSADVVIGYVKLTGTTGSLSFQVRNSSGVSVGCLDIKNSSATECAVVVEVGSFDVDFGRINVNGCPSLPVLFGADCTGVTVLSGRFKNLSKIGGSVIRNASVGAIIKGIVLEPIGAVKPLYGIENTGNYCIISGCRIRPEALNGTGGTGAPIRDTSVGSMVSGNITS